MKLNLQQLLSLYNRVLNDNKHAPAKYKIPEENIKEEAIKWLCYIGNASNSIKMGIPPLTFFPPVNYDEPKIPEMAKLEWTELDFPPWVSGPEGKMEGNIKRMEEYKRDKTHHDNYLREIPHLQKEYKEDLEHNTSIIEEFFIEIGYSHSGTVLEEIKRLIIESMPESERLYYL